MRDACAGPEVETVSSRHLRDLEANRQNPLEMTANQGPPFEGPDPEAPEARAQKAQESPAAAAARILSACGPGATQRTVAQGERSRRVGLCYPAQLNPTDK